MAQQNTETSNMFNVAMASDSRIFMEVLVNECGGVFQGVRFIVDVGGGTGETAMTIARAFPHIKCTMLDLPHWILHDWSDEDCVRILRRCKEANPSSKEEGGKVIIVDVVVDAAHNNNPKTTETKLYADLPMMVHTGGKERDESQWLKIFMDAGFNQYNITPALGLRSVIELYP
ncbi:trans-resveratrol di-O-methyltransferase-like protein [Cinnamomum micranthum f. kanehirae]|uniref:Trans-resveratrol di-O-methyltransferase-like protein n=1 Tax=Cinnamomum micranthum f. kanehirae TaxID=337451 RepID=A0A443PFV5_9MAGN|nr:trans-resveratrol di-O-methyltransferase-like protein [Cinnamomum micranthum f. kanehirae]